MMLVSMTMPQARRSEATIGGLRVYIRPHPHKVLERLLLGRPNDVSIDALIDAVWPHPDDEPQHAAGQVRGYILFLRELGIPVVLPGYGRGYSLPDLEPRKDPR